MTKRPNILYLHSHDTGRYIQPYGHAIPTPNLQKLAEEGVLFRNNFCINPTCSPSRAALLTGSYPHENGMTGLAHRGFALNDYGQHIIHALREAGYKSALAGVQHIAHGNEDREPWEIIGYDVDLGRDGCQGAAEFLDSPPAEPFFLSVGFGDTHRVFVPIDECPDDPRYCLSPAPVPDTPETRQDMTRYKGSARLLDRKMGDVLNRLESSGLAKNTLVICTTDHGIAFPRMKCNLNDSGTGTMLIMRGPGGFSGGKVIDGMTTHLDIYPTICEMLQIEPPAWLRGSSLLPLLNDNVDEIHDEIFFEVNYHAAYEPMRAVRTRRWKYIRRFGGRAKPVLVNCDAGASKSVWLEHGWKDHQVDAEELYDLIFDPNEMNNLVSSADHSDVLDEMRERLQQWMRDTEDPLLSGSIPQPEGARVNSADDISI